jgi:hypothetical protein
MLSPQSGREDISAVIFASSRPKGMHLGRTGLVMSIAAPGRLATRHENAALHNDFACARRTLAQTVNRSHPGCPLRVPTAGMSVDDVVANCGELDVGQD